MPRGHFIGELHAVMLDDGRRMRRLEAFGYVDPKGVEWPVPKGLTTDGASIPRALWTILGGPFEGRHRKAAVVHDWYCDYRIRPWEQVHRMFFDAMIAADVAETQAKILYFGVRLGGPRWNEQQRLNAGLQPPPLDRVARAGPDAYADFTGVGPDSSGQTGNVGMKTGAAELWTGDQTVSFDDGWAEAQIQRFSARAADASLAELEAEADMRRAMAG